MYVHTCVGGRGGGREGEVDLKKYFRASLFSIMVYHRILNIIPCAVQ